MLLDFVLQTFILALVKIVCLLVTIAYYTAAERKIMASIQRRTGPNVVGFWGLLQPFADGLKLVAKELLIPARATTWIFVFAPVSILTLSLLAWSVIPFGLYSEFVDAGSLGVSHWGLTFEKSGIADIKYSILFVLAISSLNVYGIIIAGWASNSKYAFLGALRSAAQMISYEVSIGLTLLPVVLFAGSLNFGEIVLAQINTIWFIFPLLPCACIFFISMLAETNRAPFDLPEAEAELVAGYNVEYSSIIFAMFFLAEYSNMILMCAIFSLLFLGGWDSPAQFLGFLPQAFWFSLKIVILCFLFVLVRATFPRYRYDQLMDIGWKVFLPITLAYLVFTTSLLLIFDALPEQMEIAPFNAESVLNSQLGLFLAIWPQTSKLELGTIPSQNLLSTTSYLSSPSWFTLLPEITLLFSIIAGFLLVAYFYPKVQTLDQKKKVTSLLIIFYQLTLFIVFLLLLCNPYGWHEAQFFFHLAYSVDFYSSAGKLLIVLTTLFVLEGSKFYVQHHYRAVMEYPILLIFSMFFLCLLVSAFDFMCVYLCLVGFSLNLYILLLFNIKSTRAREAGVKYFYLSTFSTGIILFGIFLIYFLFLTTNFLNIKVLLFTYIQDEIIFSQIFAFVLVIVSVVIGFLFKLSAFPCHLWTPEVYEGSPNPVFAFFVLPVKIAVLFIFIRILGYVFAGLVPVWQPCLVFASAGSLAWGCLAALHEKKVKRFFAYASINQMGFILMGVSCASLEGIRISFLYLVLYILMNFGFFCIFLTTSRNNSLDAFVYLSDLNYFAQKEWFYSYSLVVVLFSMAGIPPLAGFFGKFFLLLHCYQAGLFFLVVLGLITSLISTFYYIRLIKVLWFEVLPTNSRIRIASHLIQFPGLLATLFLAEHCLFLFIFIADPVIQTTTHLGLSALAPLC